MTAPTGAFMLGGSKTKSPPALLTLTTIAVCPAPIAPLVLVATALAPLELDCAAARATTAVAARNFEKNILIDS